MREKYYSVGTIGIASKDIEALAGIIPKGAIVQIVGVDDVQPSRGYELLDLDTGVKLIETGFYSIIPTEIEYENNMNKRGRKH